MRKFGPQHVELADGGFQEIHAVGHELHGRVDFVGDSRRQRPHRLQPRRDALLVFEGLAVLLQALVVADVGDEALDVGDRAGGVAHDAGLGQRRKSRTVAPPHAHLARPRERIVHRRGHAPVPLGGIDVIRPDVDGHRLFARGVAIDLQTGRVDVDEAAVDP